MDARHRAGVFYRAMPAVGADGKSIMKLIPVQVAKRRFNQTLQGRPPSDLQESPTVAPSAASLLQKSGGAVNPRMPGALPLQLPVTVESPALPRGQCLQIPPHAQVQRVPASHLPPEVKEQIFASLSSSGLASVVYVSPVTTVDQRPPGPPRPFSTGLPPLKPHLKLIPKVSQRPSSPTRWVIEEVDSPPAQNPKSSPPPGGHQLIQEDALVVCNGKVFFVGLKSSSAVKTPPETSKSNSPPNCQLAECRPPPQPGEVIDLCDDEDPDAADPSHDEDNVIFVSYTHPRSEPGSAEDPTSEKEGGGRLSPCRVSSSGGGRSFSVRDVDIICSSEVTHGDQRAQDPLSGAGPPAEEEQPCEDPASRGTRVLGLRESERQLRRRFGIHAELRVCLQKVHADAAHLKSEEPTNRQSQLAPPHLNLHSPREEDGAAPLKETSSAGESRCLLSGSCCPEAQSVIGYVEPIDEDLPEVPPPSQACVAVSRRIGRTRKRTTCPCCIPVALLPRGKSCLEEGEGGHPQQHK
uniref:Uncharacterized protein n=1 Tax=Oryzias latipes TaxID=8090 RepID=A0A3P9LJG3_ORYLA